MGCKALQLQDYFQLIDGDTRRVVFNKYDEFDRVIRNTETVFNKGKAQSAVKRTYAYSPYGKRTRLTVTTYGLMGGKMVKQDVLKTKWKFNKFGQLVKIEKGSDVVEYLYNAQGRVLKRTSNGMKQYYTYTPLEQLETKSLGAPYDSENKTAIATLKYIYATDSSINARIVNGAKQSYRYDKIGQLTAVVNAAGEKVEQYTYDPAGNILKKDINGEITTFTYDKSNQLVSSTVKGKTTDYEYDAAGRLVKEGGKTYAYGWLDKVMNITKNGKISNSYTYSMNGQVASANEQGKQENFVWDGLALIKRGTTEYVYEPAVTGGNPILANGKAMFNDMLGNTLGVIGENGKLTSSQGTSFGNGGKSGFFTGKPYVEGLGYAFLFRNYRADLGKWQTADPLGYPDGWNNLAYCNNGVIDSIDFLGAYEIEWEGSWTTTQKNQVLASLAAVKARQIVNIQQINTQITNISSSGQSGTAALIANLNTLKNGLQTTVNNINSTTYNLEIYNDTIGAMATYWASPVPWYDDELTFDTSWFTTSDDKTVFHELTHTWSDDGESGNDYVNAHMFETLMVTDFAKLPIYVTDYRAIFGVKPE